MKKRIISLLLAATMCLTAFSMTGCGSSSAGGDEHTYQIWMYQAQNTSYYMDYSDNPVLKYLLQKQWNNNDLTLEFLVPAEGTAQDNWNTILASGEFPTMMSDAVSDSPSIMYDNGYIMDITDLVKENMPNYYQLVQENKKLHDKVCIDIDGEDRIMEIATVNEDVEYSWTGMVYRRDWIVEYGSNPETGEAFTGGYTDPADPDSWEDNVIFPSGATDPLYISDWEWMFDIFEKAMAAEGIEDGYCISMYYPGFTWAGGLSACFGEGGIVWYLDEDDQVQFGGDSESTRAYFECLNNWYEKGWLDQNFDERVSDSFYMIDSASYRLGKVGMWCGLESDLGNRIDNNDGGYADGIYVAGCSWPINDIYGSDECKGIEPRLMIVESDTVSTGYFAMTGADEKDLASLFTMLDYLYTDEGAVLKTIGLNAEQIDESGDTFYAEYKMADGAYTIGEDGRYKLCDALVTDSGGLSTATNLDLLPGLHLVTSIDKGYAATYENSLKQWTLYKNKGLVWGSTAMSKMNTEDNQTCSDALTNVLNYMESNAYQFINGEWSTDADGKDWKNWCSMIKRFDVDSTSKLIQTYVDAE